jgi:hypothetical protein
VAIEIRILSGWDSDDGAGRRIEVTVSERGEPWEDPSENSRWFAGGDLARLKEHLRQLIDEKAARFMGQGSRECLVCSEVVPTASLEASFICRPCAAAEAEPAAGRPAGDRPHAAGGEGRQS